MKLIGMLDSPFVRRVAISLQLLDLPFEHEALSVFSTFDEFHDINPVVKATFDIVNAGGEDVIMTIGYDFASDGLIAFDFAPDGLNRNQTALGTHLTDLFYADGEGLDSVFTSLANMLDLSSVANALDQLSPEVYVDTQLAALFASQAFSFSLKTVCLPPRVWILSDSHRSRNSASSMRVMEFRPLLIIPKRSGFVLWMATRSVPPSKVWLTATRKSGIN